MDGYSMTSLIAIHKNTTVILDKKVYTVDKDGQEHYAGTYMGWSMWSRYMQMDRPPFPEPWILYVTDAGVPEAVPIHNTRIRER